MTLLAVIIAFALFHWVNKPEWMTSFVVVTDFNGLLKEKLGIEAGQARFVAVLLVPLILLGLLIDVFNVSAFHNGHHVGHLVIHVLILFYCLGPKPMETAIENGELLKQMSLTEASNHKSIINGMTDAALHRWFGVFIWYLIIGLWGAVLYRVAQQLNEADLSDEVMKSWASKLMDILDFPAALLMTVALAVASDFEKVWSKCKPLINTETITELNCQFLYDAMYHTVEHGEIEVSTDESDAVKNDENQSNAHQVITTTMAVLKRMLVACLVFVALLVIFSAR
ncbi:hypothetical protein [Marinicella rhabdoformis]|uniref:hypothetical protein n=1 Tax=Marinicella rhabdoformis TaxID=2580566 RepID=UPI0012AEC824|nr:hypothetical protein [Marinicella rhabdoformis]